MQERWLLCLIQDILPWKRQILTSVVGVCFPTSPPTLGAVFPFSLSPPPPSVLFSLSPTQCFVPSGVLSPTPLPPTGLSPSSFSSSQFRDSFFFLVPPLFVCHLLVVFVSSSPLFLCPPPFFFVVSSSLFLLCPPPLFVVSASRFFDSLPGFCFSSSVCFLIRSFFFLLSAPEDLYTQLHFRCSRAATLSRSFCDIRTQHTIMVAEHSTWSTNVDGCAATATRTSTVARRLGQ